MLKHYFIALLAVLVLLQSAGILAPSKATAASKAASLFGKRWTLTSMGKQRFSADEPYIEFDREQKRFAGSSGCNSINGAFEINGSRLRLSRVISTRRACIDTEGQRVESNFLQLLETTTRFKIQGNTLRLYANEKLILVFGSKRSA